MRHAGDQASGSGKMKRKLYEKDLHKFQRERQLTSSSTTFLTRLRRCFTIAHPRPHRVSENFHNRATVKFIKPLLLAKEIDQHQSGHASTPPTASKPAT